MRLSIYTFEVHVADDVGEQMEGEPGTEYTFTLVDGVFQALAEVAATNVAEIDSRLTVEFKD